MSIETTVETSRELAEKIWVERSLDPMRYTFERFVRTFSDERLEEYLGETDEFQNYKIKPRPK